jgi:MFS family permease
MAEGQVPTFDQPSHPPERRIASSPYVPWCIVAAAYTLAFFQRVAPQAFVDRLMADFSLDAAGLAALLSCYFYGYLIMQVPAGVIVDRWGVRLPVIVSLAVSISATVVFAHASTKYELAVARLVGGAGDAVVFSSLIKLVGVRFAPERFAFMASASQVAGHLGGMLATAPLAIGVEVLGWRWSLVVVALMLLAILVSALVLLKEERPAVQGVSSLHQMLSQTGALLHSPLTWGPVIIWAGAYVTSLSLLGVWGQSLLMQGHGFTHTSASILMFAFMTSFSGGSLLTGHFIDNWFSSTRLPIFVVSALRIALLLCMVPAVAAYLPTGFMPICFILLGLITSATMPLVMTMLRSAFGKAALATGVGLTAAIGNLMAAVVQPVLGSILEAYFLGTSEEGTRLYAPGGFGYVLVVLAILSGISIIGAAL